MSALARVEQLKTMLRHAPYYYVENFGCQMNARDAEKIRGMLEEAGYVACSEESEADFILYNTCTVREHANERIYGRLGVLKQYRKRKPHLLIALCGCMMQEEEEVRYIREHYPFVGLIFGTFDLHRFPQLLADALSSDTVIYERAEQMSVLPEGLPQRRKYPFKAGVNISYGCDNFCSYCIVPYVRGREISRPSADILAEVEGLVEDGVREVMLLGQNVNSYGKGLDEEIDFPTLLHKIASIPELSRVRFMTSHPKDCSDALIDCMAEHETICRHMHLPAQSGSDRILAAMNRKYTREWYMSRVEKIRKAMPDCAITTDLIVGFPGETEEDVKDTISLVEEARYEGAFTFLYSKRSGTAAASMDEQIPTDVAKERFDRLLSTVRRIGAAQCERYTGCSADVLCEETNREKGLMTGRLSSNLVVHFPGDASLIGQVVRVILETCHGFYFTGRMLEA